eukprot:14209113-Alexandrium_andersonii.AAC.1
MGVLEGYGIFAAGSALLEPHCPRHVPRVCEPRVAAVGRPRLAVAAAPRDGELVGVRQGDSAPEQTDTCRL